jgi:hypothetical protein
VIYSNVSITDVVGFLGVFLYLFAYLIMQLGFIRGQSYSYPIINMLAAAFIVVSLLESPNFYSLVIQIFWIVISVFGISRIYLMSRQIKFSADEQGLVDSKMSDIPVIDARKFLRSGVWADLPVGTPLTEYNKPVERLVYLASGLAGVFVDDRKIAEIKGDCFIGEVTVIKGRPATASVVLMEPSRCFVIDAIQLRSLVQKDPAFARSLDSVLSREIDQKFREMNKIASSSAQAGESKGTGIAAPESGPGTAPVQETG